MCPIFWERGQRKSFTTFLLFAILPLAQLAPGCSKQTAPPPNIVLMIADDQSWRDFGFMGSDFIHTPNLDTLAEEGVVLSHGFNTASACRPSLQTLLTGLHPIQIQALAEVERKKGVRFPELGVIHALDTLPELLAERGYVSFQGGKYWEGSYSLAGFTTGMSRGFGSEAAGTPELGEQSLLTRMAGGRGTELGRSTMKPVFEFIDEHAGEPFFIWFAPMLPHVPHDPEQEFMQHYPSKRFSSADRRYYGNITRLDRRIGQLLAHLEQRGLRNRTLLIFLSDNGWDQAESEQSSLSNLGGPKGKLSIYENGFRTPIIFSGPGIVAIGRRDDSLVSTVDLFPTILEFAGVADRASARTGSSLYAHLTHGDRFVRDRVFGWMRRLRQEDSRQPLNVLASIKPDEAYFVRDREWRYVWYKNRRREELFEIERDPWERRNLVERHPENAERYRSAIEDWDARVRQRAIAGTK